MSYLILHNGYGMMIINAAEIEAVYEDYVMYDMNRTHIQIKGRTLYCTESVDEVMKLLKELLEGKPSV